MRMPRNPFDSSSTITDDTRASRMMPAASCTVASMPTVIGGPPNMSATRVRSTAPP